MRLRWLLGFATLLSLAAHGQWALEPYGRLDVAIETPSRRVDADNRTVATEPARLTAGSRNRVGLQALHHLAGAWRLQGTVEQTLLGLPGERLLSDGAPRVHRPLDALRLVAVSHYAYGRVGFGRRTDVVNDLPLTFHPWGGETVAGDACAAILRWPCPARLARPETLTYESPVFAGRFEFSAQWIWKSGHDPLALRLVQAQGARRMDIGLRHDGRGDWLLPLGWIEPLGPWRLHLLAVTGRTTAGAVASRADYAFAGATRSFRGSELRVGAGRYRKAAVEGDDHEHFGVGWHRPLWRDAVGYADLAHHRGRSGTSGTQLGVGLKLQFR